MSNKQSSNNKTNKKVPMIIGAVFLLIVAIAVIVFMNTGNPGAKNVDVDIEDTAVANIE